MSKALLNEILKKIGSLRSQNLEVRCVFDLDSTLFDVSPRLQKIIHDFADLALIREQFPTTSAHLKTAKTEPSDWGIKGAIQRLGADILEPELREKAKDYWRKNFFSNHYLWFDEPMKGAVEFVQLLHRLQVKIVYLSGRDEERMGTGTREVLSHFGFPTESDGAVVALKPNNSGEDESFKTEWFAANKATDQRADASLWFFENEPLNIHRVLADHPEIQVVFLKTTHAGRAEPPDSLPTLTDFLY
jgi:hypothetical protein